MSFASLTGALLARKGNAAPSKLAAPAANPVSTMPRESELVASTHMVLLNSSWAFCANNRARAPL